MKQVININFQGRVVPIEVTAFDMLKSYTESLNKHFANEEGKEEIINDIESRIGELFQERLKGGSTCITDEDVKAIINSMGRPEDFEISESTASTGNTAEQQSTTQQAAYTATSKRLYRDENNKILGGVCSGLGNYFNIDPVIVRIIFIVTFGVAFLPYLVLWIAVPGSSSNVIGGARKKLYRDGDDKIIGGVCSGIGHYFGINPWIPRALFLLPFLSFVFRWGHWDFPNFLSVGFSPGSLIIYIILWCVMPEANTTAEKLEMKGEKIDIDSIKNSVMEEMKGIQQRAEKFSATAAGAASDAGKTVGAEVAGAAKRGGRSLGDIIVFLFKLFAYFILGIIGISLIVGLFSLGIFAIGIFPLKDFLLNDGWQNAYAWGTLLFFIATPIIGIITWIIRRIAKIKKHSRSMRLGFSALWVLGWICFILLISSVSRDFKKVSTPNEQEIVLTNPTVNKLEVTSIKSNSRFTKNNWFRLEPFEDMEEDTAYVKNVDVHILKSPNDSFRVTMVKMANGPDKNAANLLADRIQYTVVQADSLLQLEKGIAINKTEKFRNQRIILTIYVPVGKQIRVNSNIGWGYDVHFGGPWNDRDDFDFDTDTEEHGWNRNTDYIMKADGLYTLDGEPADEWKHNNRNVRINNDRIDIDGGSSRVRVDANGIIVEDGYRYNNGQPMNKVDSMKIKLQREQEQLKDSLEKAKEKIDKQLQRLDNEPETPQPLSAYHMPAIDRMQNIN